MVYLNDVSIGPALVRLVVLCVFEQDLVHVGAGVLEQLVGVVEDDEGDLTVAQHAQLVRLLHQAKLPLGERHLGVRHTTFIHNTNTFLTRGPSKRHTFIHSYTHSHIDGVSTSGAVRVRLLAWGYLEAWQGMPGIEPATGSTV